MKVYSQGDQAIVVSLKGDVTPAATEKLLLIRHCLIKQNDSFITEIVPTETDMMISYDARMMMKHLNITSPFLHMKALIENIDTHEMTLDKEIHCVKVPIVYGGAHGPHLDMILKELKMDRQTFIDIHTGADYFASMMGYSPGFPYLSGVAPQIIVNHTATEARLIPAGSVILENNKCGITTTETYSDWLVIGHTSLPLFNPKKEDFALISLGDHVKFFEVQAGGNDA